MRRRNDNQSAGLGLNVGLIGGIVLKFSFLAGITSVTCAALPFRHTLTG